MCKTLGLWQIFSDVQTSQAKFETSQFDWYAFSSNRLAWLLAELHDVTWFYLMFRTKWEEEVVIVGPIEFNWIRLNWIELSWIGLVAIVWQDCRLTRPMFLRPFPVLQNNTLLVLVSSSRPSICLLQHSANLYNFNLSHPFNFHSTNFMVAPASKN